MPWFLRKSFLFGPLRLNLSKRGLGASVGVTGARLGIDATGKPYAAGGRAGRIVLPGPPRRAARGRYAVAVCGANGAVATTLVVARRARAARRPCRRGAACGPGVMAEQDEVEPSIIERITQ